MHLSGQDGTDGNQLNKQPSDKDNWDWDFLGTSKPSSGPGKMPVKHGTERSSETTAEQSSRKELPPRQTPLRTVAPVQRRKTSMFEDAEGDDLLDVLRRGKGPKKEEELRPARSTLDDLFGRGSAAKVLEKPEEEERGDKKELVFGEYKPSMGSRPAVQPAMGQLVRFSANSSSETNPEPRSTPRPPRRRNPVRRRRAGDDWLGWEDEDFMDPASQLGAAEEAAPKPDPMDWLIDALARRRAEEQAKAQETKAEPTETQEKKAKPSETEEKKAEPSEAQEKKNEPSEAQDTTAEPSETAGEGPGPRSPGSQLAASPAASDCRAELLSAQAHVAELESQESPSACWMGAMGDPGEEKGPCLLQTASG
ncbi:fas-binding factor 1 homolog [Columba livia]|uniref:fas-binding factor 1 homolog n=1 Tax=Columba livia TaxID=8932 RepID=UPI0031BB72B0